MSPRRYSTYSYRLRGFCTPIGSHERAEDNGFLTNRPNAFPSHARSSSTSLDLNATCERDRKIFVCVCVCVCICVCGSMVPEEVDASVEFGGPYINQFHYHRDQGASEFPLTIRATPRDGTRRGKGEVRIRFVRFRSRNFSLREIRRSGGESRAITDRVVTYGLCLAPPKTSPIVDNFLNSCSKVLRRVPPKASTTISNAIDSNNRFQWNSIHPIYCHKF